MRYLTLGSQQELCKAELKAVLSDSFDPVHESSSVVVVESGFENASVLQDRLAGVIKIGSVIGELKQWDLESAAELIAVQAQDAAGKNKISFGLSVYDLGDASLTRALEKEVDALGQEIKKHLKASGRPVRYVKAREPRLSSAVIETNGLLSSGGEYALLAAHGKILIGQTETIQDFRAWERRDFGRPARNAKSGMLPPKLARMMINLSGVDPEGATLLDPFCGSGTVLMEAALMGFARLIGSDISEAAVQNTGNNLDWLTTEFQLEDPHLELHTTPAVDLPSLVHEQADIIVTEVYLGSPRSKPLTDDENKKIEQDLMTVYETSFSALKLLLKPSGRAVIAFPAFKQKEGTWYRLPLEKMLVKLGYRVESQFLYHRNDQLVGRDILVLTH
ncbi:50S ribosomal protein L11 methyltransferase [Candidatus Uhrbacteria bacterium]|nr:50S ribosomal protein L11 methyltransferase [Candidatus Uhrbacteria bacterium]